MKIVCTGDLHMGRRSTRVPDGDGSAPLSSTECWRRIVDHAIGAQVDAVLLSGDVIDQDNRFFEAVGPLESGLERLRDAGIPVAAVAGNHDHDVLSGVADALPGAFTLLGRGGSWEAVVVQTRSGPLRVAGWSFPDGRVTTSPIDSLSLQADGIPTVGLLHGDLDVAASPYAPVSAQALRARGADFWLLGHVHAPFLDRSGDPPILYPGSPQALDPGEPGAHGVWLVDPTLRPAVAELVPLSTVLYTTVEVSAEGCVGAGEVKTRMVEALRELRRAVAAEPGAIRRVSARVRVVGRTPAHGALANLLRDADDALELGDDRLSLHLDEVTIATRPAVDLDALARTDDACGFLARLVLAMDAGSFDGFEALLANVEQATRAVYHAGSFARLEGRPPDGEGLRDQVRRRALDLLDTLLAHREVAA